MHLSLHEIALYLQWDASAFWFWTQVLHISVFSDRCWSIGIFRVQSWHVVVSCRTVCYSISQVCFISSHINTTLLSLSVAVTAHILYTVIQSVNNSIIIMKPCCKTEMNIYIYIYIYLAFQWYIDKTSELISHVINPVSNTKLIHLCCLKN